MSVLFRSTTTKGRALGTRKALAGMVEYELSDIEGRPVVLDFQPRVEYREEYEPKPWCVVADPGKIIAAGAP